MVAQNNSAKTRNQVTSKSGISVDANLSIRQLKQNQKMAAKKAAQAAKIAKKNNGPGRMKQMWQVFQMTRKNDPASQWWIIGALVIGAVVGVLLAFFFRRRQPSGDHPLGSFGSAQRYFSSNDSTRSASGTRSL